MSSSAKAEALLALHRFGMGPRPGSVAAIEADPRGALIAELERPSAAELAAANLLSSAKAFRAVTDANAKRQAKAIVAKKEQDAKRQQMAEAPAMMEGAAQGQGQGTGETAAKIAAEAVPDPSRPRSRGRTLARKPLNRRGLWSPFVSSFGYEELLARAKKALPAALSFATNASPPPWFVGCSGFSVGKSLEPVDPAT